MNDNRRKERQGNKKSLGGLIALVLVFVLNIMSELDSDVIGIFIVLAVLIVMALVFVKAFTAGLAKTGNSAQTTGKSFGFGQIKHKGFTMPSWNRDEVEIPLTAQTKSSAAAVYDYEKASQGNSQRDMERRMKQLDGFLKNGIIEKEEYNILKARYMKNYK